MIPVKKLSPSSISTFDMCQMKWVLQYIMGYREPSGKAAAIGSCCHYILEGVAHSKLLRQQGKKYKKDKVLGTIKAKYDIQDWIDKSYGYFTKENDHLNWEDKDYREVCRNIKKTQDHPLFPENHQEIIYPEQFINLKIDKPWSKYSYLKGSKIDRGDINFVGVVDLIFRDENGTLNFLDYKFGQPVDWATGEKKTYATIIKDTQLCMYYYAIKQKYPNEDIVANIWYVKHDTVFSDMFGPSQEKTMMDKLERTLLNIRSIEKPNTNYSFKCGFCSFKKTNFADWDRPELDIGYNSKCHFDDINGKACVCDATKTFIDYRGLTSTIENASFKKG